MPHEKLDARAGQSREGPRYLAIAEAIEADIAAGRLAPGDRLPPQRELAQAARAGFHDRRARLCRGVASAACWSPMVGRGTFVRRKAMVLGEAGPRRSRADFSMNMPPEPEDPELLARMRAGFASVAEDLDSLLALPGFWRLAGSTATRRRPGLAAARWCPRRSGCS